MATAAGKYSVDIEQVEEKGKVWNVRLSQKRLFFKKNISSDWFLNELQAQTFAKQLIDQVANNPDIEGIKTRKPGWTLVRPNH